MTNQFNRRADDRRLDKRDAEDRRLRDRRLHESLYQKLRFPGFGEQRIQFITRYVFVVLGLYFFNLISFSSPSYTSLEIINLVFAAYFIFISLAFYHAWRWPIHVTRYHLVMWADILLVALSVVNDPYDIPPSLVVFIMIVLGNGMRYGMRLFGEALAGCFGAVMVALSIRFFLTPHSISAGLIFLDLFGSIILIYSYILMTRIETARSNLERNIRTSDIAARHGGDEFVVLMPETGIKHGEQAAHRVQTDFAAWAAEAGLPCNASIGLSEAPRDGRNLDQLLATADAALYHAKSIQSGGVMCVDQLPADYHRRSAQA